MRRTTYPGSTAVERPAPVPDRSGAGKSPIHDLAGEMGGQKLDE